MTIEPVVVTLSEPVVFKDKTYETITFTRTTRGKDLALMDTQDGDMKKSFALFASMAGVPFQVFMEMSTDDYADVALAVAPLMGKQGKALQEARKEKEPEDSGVI